MDSTLKLKASVAPPKGTLVASLDLLDSSTSNNVPEHKDAMSVSDHSEDLDESTVTIEQRKKALKKEKSSKNKRKNEEQEDGPLWLKKYKDDRNANDDRQWKEMKEIEESKLKLLTSLVDIMSKK